MYSLAVYLHYSVFLCNFLVDFIKINYLKPTFPPAAGQMRQNITSDYSIRKKKLTWCEMHRLEKAEWMKGITQSFLEKGIKGKLIHAIRR